jgi:large conductance mechanosensitive channel
MFKEFKEFAIKGNVVDLAVGLIIGSAFGGIVKSLVDDIIMPPLGFLLGNVDFSNLFITIKNGGLPPPYYTVADASKAGAIIIKYGIFINTLVSFAIISFSVFLLIQQLNRFKKDDKTIVQTNEPTSEVNLLTEIRDLLKKRMS